MTKHDEKIKQAAREVWNFLTEGGHASFSHVEVILSRHFPAPSAEALQPTDGADPATETRWQDAIYEKCKKAVGPENDSLIDGGGCDSGDALDVSLAEIGQAIGYWRDKAEADSPKPVSEEEERKAFEAASYYPRT